MTGRARRKEGSGQSVPVRRHRPRDRNQREPEHDACKHGRRPPPGTQPLPDRAAAAAGHGGRQHASARCRVRTVTISAPGVRHVSLEGFALAARQRAQRGTQRLSYQHLCHCHSPPRPGPAMHRHGIAPRRWRSQKKPGRVAGRAIKPARCRLRTTVPSFQCAGRAGANCPTSRAVASSAAPACGRDPS